MRYPKITVRDGTPLMVAEWDFGPHVGKWELFSGEPGTAEIPVLFDTEEEALKQQKLSTCVPQS